MAEARIKDTNYFQISGWMLNRLRLKGIQLEIYAIIYGFSQDGESEFTGSIQYLCEFTGTSRPTVIKALKELTDKKYLLKDEKIINGIKFNRYKVNLQVVKKLYLDSKETLLGGGKETLLGGSKETLHNNKLLDNELLNNNINNNAYAEIINYLNEKAGTNYKHTTKSTQEHIKARLNDNFSIENFKTVIDKKCAEWKGTEFEQYLRPQTLFGTKFESYLNSKVTKVTQNKTSTLSEIEKKQNAELLEAFYSRKKNFKK
jgi:uncharacterized phage protein (TIGR02220 family)